MRSSERISRRPIWPRLCLTDAAPPFPKIAEKGHAGPTRPERLLAAPHPPMPDFNLARQQIDDIVAYLDSLAAH
jgi:hypothetical protein